MGARGARREYLGLGAANAPAWGAPTLSGLNWNAK